MSLLLSPTTEIERVCGLAGSGSQILPIIIGNEKRCSDVALALQQAGFDVRPIRPPTVPEGTARLRLALSLHVTRAQTADLLSCLAEQLKRKT